MLALPKTSVLKLSLGCSLFLVSVLLGAIFFAGAPEADAAAYTLTGSCVSPCAWSTTTNWSPNGVPGSAVGDTADICGVGKIVTVDINVPQGVTLNMSCTTATVNVPAAGSLQLEQSSTLGSGGNAITVN